MTAETTDLPSYLRWTLQKYFDRVIGHGDNSSSITTAKVEYLWERPVSIVRHNDLIVHLVFKDDESVVKGFIKKKDPKAAIQVGPGGSITALRQTFTITSDGFTCFVKNASKTEACSEVYMNNLPSNMNDGTKWKLVANLAFHELMHNLCLMGDSLHNVPGVVLGKSEVDETMEPSPADLSLMAKHLRKAPKQWLDGRSYWFSDPSRVRGGL